MSEQAKYLGSNTRVDYRLLMNLKELSKELRARHGLSGTVAHALIGKYIYFRYLHDRGILDNQWLSLHDVVPDAIFGRSPSAAAFGSLSHLLDTQFNGDVFPLQSDDDGIWRTNGAIRSLLEYLTETLLRGNWPSIFKSDFSYIPVSTVFDLRTVPEKREEGRRRWRRLYAGGACRLCLAD